MEALQIRSAQPTDAALLLSLWREADAEPSATDDAAAIAALIQHHADGVLIAEIDGVAVGSLVATWDGWRGNMYRLAVAPEHRRLGIARALVDEGERRLRAMGCVRVTALVMHEHDPAISFWSAAAYDEDTRIVRFVKTLR